MKKFITTVCAGFTGCILFYTLFSELEFMVPINKNIVFELFFIDVAIAAFMQLYEVFTKKTDISLVADGIIRLLICYATVGAVGFFFDLFPVSPRSLFYMSIVLIPTFFTAYLLIYLSAAKYADEINHKIEQRKKPNRH